MFKIFGQYWILACGPIDHWTKVSLLTNTFGGLNWLVRWHFVRWHLVEDHFWLGMLKLRHHIKSHLVGVIW